MGGRISQLFGRWFPKVEPELRVGMLGLDNAGKTTILYQLKLDRNIESVPTVGFNVEKVRCGKMVMNIWDVSGSRPRTRVLWEHYNQNTRAIIFVVDATDVRRLPRALDELRWLWCRPELAEAVFLLFANKQDLPGALGAEQLMALLQLQSLTQQWAIQECCAINGMGLAEGLQQLQQMLTSTRGKRHSGTYSIK
ncbi:ADP-ribosylation factor 4-like [Rhagoletis pomonella]|uniref:ADP-ribosylation factor 4-like n=1 Tax=Rhagoletis pomonella TaxID=28610 RepID=UPI001784570A|nr:ADP-ribosylation factor 4-like [Rhagoletis pomonella]